MLSSLVKEHQARQVVRKEQQEAKKKEALTAANNLTTALVDHLNVGVAQVDRLLSSSTVKISGEAERRALFGRSHYHFITEFS